MVRDPQAEDTVAEEVQDLPAGEPSDAASDSASDLAELRGAATEFASRLGWLPGVRTSRTFSSRSRKLKKAFQPLFAGAEAAAKLNPESEDLRWFLDNDQLIYGELRNLSAELKPLKRLPHVRGRKGEVVPRVLALAQALLDLTGNRFRETTFTAFFQAFQENSVLELLELSAAVSAMKLVLLERIAARCRCLLRDPAASSNGLGICVRSLRDVTQTSWKDVLEPLVLFDAILRRDPAGVYAAMDFESRRLYREKLSKIARRSDLGEMDVARRAVELAEQAMARTHSNARSASRQSHIGYYLIGEGRDLLCQKVGFKPDFLQSLRARLRRHPDEFFLTGIAVLTFAIITGILLWLTPADSPPQLLLLSMLILLVPCSQSAVQLMHYLVAALLPAEILPKLDYSQGIPEDCVTLVAIPTLLLSEKQVRGLVEDLEVRFLGNHDRNIHFALITDLPDSDEPSPEANPLIDLCASLLRELDERYSGKRMGSFFLLHRHRVYNRREKGWMGWERKRGKLLDLNNLLRGEYDSFPVKTGDLSILPKVRFVLTLDSDTELPRGAAHRMVGTMTHPLNQAIIDPKKNIVVAGYGILQPRVAVSVQSTARSRLAAIYAGETGLDIYTRALSDAYQDLYGEGSYTGKGIYEVDTVHQVLDRRFPKNALLSHDLIEGAYARAGLASDIEVIEDYPSHYSASNRRKHRWLRGDWQIAEWLTSRVPDESGARVANPISLVSRWKILDNLRRSLVEPATFLLFLFDWLVPGERALRWTLATVLILIIPSWFEFAFGLVRAAVERKMSVAREAVATFYAANFSVLLNLVFLAHQTLLSLDAVARALVRRKVTRERLLEWETAAQAELGTRQTVLDRYLDWMPFFAVGLGLLVWRVRPHSLIAAIPVLALWAGSKAVALWLNESPVVSKDALSRQDRLFLRRSALYTWRYFAEFCTEEHNWLIPDNIQEEPPAVAARISPTNLGLLLNARQVAVELGYLTVPELTVLTERTLTTVSRLVKHRGHLLNWYDTRTLAPLTPLVVSSVDSGNLLASLWTLQQGCLDRIRQPLLHRRLAEGLLDHLQILAEAGVFPRKQLAQYEAKFREKSWLPWVLELREGDLENYFVSGQSSRPADARWFYQQAQLRLQNIRQMTVAYEPWWLPEFAPLRESLGLNAKFMGRVPLQKLPDLIRDLEGMVERVMSSIPEADRPLCESFRARLEEARSNARSLIETLRRLSAQAGALADAMDFSFLLDPHRKLMSVGFDAQSRQLLNSCYDLLATESRTAVFIAIAKDDIPQDCWFLLGRGHTLDHGRPVLLSWTGTMFEYLMPSLWMRSYPNTLLDRSEVAAVRSQQAYAARKGVPWGISESAYSKLDGHGNYQYQAFGLPQLSLMRRESNPLVISPYSTFLALSVDRRGALRNLRRMDALGWFGRWGFYESADYTAVGGRFRSPSCEIVRCWMAHHQGMSLLSMANLLCDNVVQKWFHADRRVQATELLLQEKPVVHVPSAELPSRKAVA
ncbi:MAG: glucoamylase family protein [Candidatus Sulfotelmatobacter sp.]